MFIHEERDVSDSEDDSDEEKEDEHNEDGNNQDENNEDEYLFKVKDIEPSLRKVEQAMDKIQQLLMPEQTSKLKCDKCDFEAKNNNGLNMHNKAKHPDNSL